MEIANELDWDSNDIAALRTFLSTKTGLRFIPKVLESVPALLRKGETNDILIRSGEVVGFQIAVQALLSLSSPPGKEQPAEPSAYPNLTDDAAWNDGQSLTEKK